MLFSIDSFSLARDSSSDNVCEIFIPPDFLISLKVLSSSKYKVQKKLSIIV
ncbi:MAG: hypothetical protein ACFFG0_20960 [Candidatus Thorarchaeota archaeon]